MNKEETLDYIVKEAMNIAGSNSTQPADRVAALNTIHAAVFLANSLEKK